MFSNREETDFAENHYYRLNQILLSSISLWPDRRTMCTKISHIFHFAIMGSFTFFQLTSFFTSQFTLDLAVMVLSYATPSFLYILQYYSFYANRNGVKQMWKYIRNSWTLLKDETERNIMRQHSSSGELFTITILSSVLVSMILYALTELSPAILDLIAPINETRPYELHAMTEYFVDKTIYFFPILCHWMFSLSFGVLVFMAINTLEIAYIENVCGLLEIASYRIKHIEKYESYNSEQKDYMAHRNITAAVDIHRKALECSEFLVNNFMPYFFLLVVIGVASASFNLFRMLRAIVLQNMYDFIASILFVSMHFILMFMGNYYGQKITDSNNEVFNTAYNIRWYKTPVKIQKLLLFIMQHTTIPYSLNVGYLIFASLEGFTKLISTSMSYFTIIYTLL